MKQFGLGSPPPPCQVSDNLRSVINAIMHVGAWASGYTAAQYWYAATIYAVTSQDEARQAHESSLGNFATVARDGSFDGTLSGEALRDGFLYCISINIMFGCLSYGMVKIQLYINRDESNNWGHMVAVTAFVKVLDSIFDGATFFSTNLLFVCCVSAWPFSDGGGWIWFEMMLFSLVLTFVLFLITAVTELTPRPP